MALSPLVPELRALELIVTVARTGSFGRAAREHGVSQAAVSSRVRYTERLMRMALFERSPSGVRPTPEGLLVVQWAIEVLESASAFEGALVALRQDTRARLRIVASLTAAEYLVPSLLAAMRDENPGVAVSLTAANSAQVAERVASGQDSLGFVEGPTVPIGLRSMTVVSDRLEVVVAPGHAWSRRSSPLDATELAATPLILREEGSGTRATLEEACRGRGALLVNPIVELTSTTAVKTAVAAGLGAAVLSGLAVADEIASGRLVRVPVCGVDLRRRVQAVWPTGRPLLGPARDFVAIVRRTVTAPPGRSLEVVAG